MSCENLTVIGRPLPREGGHHMLAWNIPPSELIHIPEHWLSYPEPEASIHYLLGLLCIAFFVVSTLGNGLVIWIFSSSKSLQTASNIFVLNLAFCDLIMTLKIPIFIYNSFNLGYATGHIGCQIYGFVGSLSGIAAGMTNACIAYDRYTTIVKPFDGKVTHMKAFFMVGCIWAYTLPWAVLPLVEVWGRFVPDLPGFARGFEQIFIIYFCAEGFLTACSFDYLMDTFDNHMFVAVLFTLSYVVPMTAIIYYYSQIVSHVINHEKLLKKQARRMNVESLRSNKNQQNTSVEIRIAKAAITVCLMFVASWTPYAVLALIGAFGNKALLTPGVTMIPACACKLVACIDPYIYAISHPRYRMELQKKLPCLAIQENISETQSETTKYSTAAEPSSDAAPPAPTNN